MPDLRGLRTFVVVAEELNFTRAAERLHLAQQVVSRHVAQLEAELGVELLNRTTHRVSLTPAGAVLLAQGSDAVAAADAAFGKARAVAHGLAGTVRLGLSPAIGDAVCSQAVNALSENDPGTIVALHEVFPSAIEIAIRHRTVDAVLVRSAPRLANVRVAALRPTPGALYVPAGHRLSRRSAVRLSDLDGERLLTWSPNGSAYSDLLVELLRKAGANVQPVLSPVAGGGLPPPLAATNAVAILPTSWAADEQAVVVPLEDSIDLPLFVAWPTGTESEVVRRLRNALGPTDRATNANGPPERPG